MCVISVDIIPSRNHLHPIVSCDNAMCLNLGGASIIASSIVTVPRRRTYSTILSVKSESVSASSNHRSSAVVQSWNASIRPTSGLYVDRAARALITLPITMPPTQVFIRCRYIHHLLTRPDLKQSGHLIVQCLVEHIREHPACLMKNGLCNLTSGCVSYVRTRIRSHLLSFDEHADRFERECLLRGKICHILGV